MADRNLERGEQRKDQRPQAEREPQEDAQPNHARIKDDQGRDGGRPGSDSGGGD
ncbi:hypothetical protein GRI40_03240 [Altererythrobacter aerius]|uniref:Uncharacterized protein n=1 Tax=Tsuneonella aeria TaxID=1837929 RepID=A0A6I4TC57_9SPHN|nr:hypothetical protein [Tsuneonella aeria]MXO74237.1 hypothetical protein [Tsuneonella aeria]